MYPCITVTFDQNTLPDLPSEPIVVPAETESTTLSAFPSEPIMVLAGTESASSSEPIVVPVGTESASFPEKARHKEQHCP